MGVACARCWAVASLALLSEPAGSESSSCNLKEVDLRGIRSWVAFMSEFDDEDTHEPVLLRGVTDGWSLANWTLTRMVEKVGETKVWPREMRWSDPSAAARTTATSFREFISEIPTSVAVHEGVYTNLTRALDGAYVIPRPFRTHVHTSPVVSITRQGSGIGFHMPHGGFAFWIGQVFGSTSWAIHPPGAKVKNQWPWPKDLDRFSGSTEGITCVLEPGDGMFMPKHYQHAVRGEDDLNVAMGWQGDTRSTGELELALNAISDGDIKALTKAVAGFPTNQNRKLFLTPCVNHAMQTGHMAVLKMLHKLGGSFDEETPMGGTILHQAASSGQAEAIRFALQDGADPSVKHSKDGSYPMHQAAQSGHEEVLEVLLSKAKNIWKVKDLQGRQPLHIAAAHGHTAALQALLRRRAQADAQDKNKFTALHWAVEEGQRPAVEYLLEQRAKIEAKAWESETPLFRAAVKGHISLAEMLVDQRANLEATREGGQTPVHVAAFVGHVAMLKLLQARGANMTPAKAAGQYAPEGLAASAGHSKVLDFLRDVKEKKVDFEGQDWSIQAAVQAGHVAMVRKLLESEVKMGPPAERRFQLAITATEKGHLAMVEFLLEGGLLKAIGPGATMLMQAASTRGHSTLVGYMAKQPGVELDGSNNESDPPIMLAAGAGHVGVVKKLLKLRADLERRNSKDASALHLAVLRDRAGAVTALLEGGASMRAETDAVIGTANETGRTHIHVAAAAGHMGVARALLEKRADAMSKDIYGFVPHFLVAEQGHVDMFKLLVKARADPMYQVVADNSTGTETEFREATALSIAGGQGHLGIVRYLLQDTNTQGAKQVAKLFGEKHGAAWQADLEKALKLQTREQSEEKMKEAMANPETRKSMQQFNEMYAKLSPRERLVIDQQLKAKMEEDEAKRKFQESEERKRKRRLAEL